MMAIKLIDNFKLTIDTINMTMQQIHYLLAVGRTGSFSAAAEECFVTQPTLSIQIRKLERELGVELLDRSAKPVVPTGSGRLVLERAEASRRLFESIGAVLGEGRTEVSGRVVLGVIPTLSQYLVPRFLADFLKAHPAVTMELREETSDDILRGLRSGSIDFGILAVPASDPALEESSLFYEEFVGYFPRDYSIEGISGSGGTLRVEALPWRDMLLLAEGHCFRDQVVDICHRGESSAGRRLEFETGSLESLKRLVEQGLGYTLLPELAALEVDSDGPGRLIPLAPPCPSRELGLVYPRGCSRLGVRDALVAAVRSCLPAKLRRNAGERAVPWRGGGAVAPKR